MSKKYQLRLDVYVASSVVRSTPRCNIDLNRFVSGKGIFTSTNPWKNCWIIFIIIIFGTMKVIFPFIMSIIAIGFIAAIGFIPPFATCFQESRCKSEEEEYLSTSLKKRISTQQEGKSEESRVTEEYLSTSFPLLAAQILICDSKLTHPGPVLLFASIPNHLTLSCSLPSVLLTKYDFREA